LPKLKQDIAPRWSKAHDYSTALRVAIWLLRLPAVITSLGDNGNPALDNASATQVLQVRNRLNCRVAE
jgi:hypothetical protein